MKPLLVLGLLLCASGAFAQKPGEPIPAVPDDEHFRVEILGEGLCDAMEIAVAPDGRIFIVERTGGVKLFDPETGEVRLIQTISVEVRQDTHARECGLLGIALDPNFTENHWLYLYYSVPGMPYQRLSRFTFMNDSLEQEQVLLQFAHNRENGVCHEGGSLAFGPDGNLYLSTGDNTCPFESSGYAPIDEREGRIEFDAQRSAGSTNDLRGKILRIRPTPNGLYAIPDGNLFPLGTPRTKPEIYAMGCRNPFRISIDQRTGFLYWGEVGPDAGTDSERGSRGFDEINEARGPGNYGWPYFVASNLAYADYDFTTGEVGQAFDPHQPVNDSPNNNGQETLPPATPPLWYYPRASACAGPVYYYDDYPDFPGKLPQALDGSLIVYDWTSAWLRLLRIDEDGNLVSNEPWLSRHFFIHPVDVEMGPKGEVYLLEYGSPWYDGSDGRLKRITYSEEPIALDVTPADPRMKGLDPEHPGTTLLSRATCLACHMTEQKSIGPTYRDVAKKYANDPEARDQLAAKILSGGAGSWGPVPMPPHPQYNIEETQQMVDAILELGKPRVSEQSDSEQ